MHCKRKIEVIAMILITTMTLSGCAEKEPALAVEDAKTNAEKLQRVMIRGFLDQMAIGAGDEVFRVRVGGVSFNQEGIPFDGYVIATLEPQNPDEQDWIPLIWNRQVDEDRFRDNTGLPYWEFTGDGSFLQKGEPLLLTLEVQLADGRILNAERETYA
jgi:hypothetical protein